MAGSVTLLHVRRLKGATVLLLSSCGHTPLGDPSSDVLAVTELAARYALEHDVPAVLREGSPLCLSVDGRAPPTAVLVRLSSGPQQVSASGPGCAEAGAVFLEVSDVVVSGDSATAHAGVRLGPSGVLELRRLEGQWRVFRTAGQVGAGSGFTLPGRR
jgi:hypothetical protein